MGTCCEARTISSEQSLEERRIAQARIEQAQNRMRKLQNKKDDGPLSKNSLAEEVEEAFRKYDTDGNGTLDINEATEFLKDWMAKHAGNSEEAAAITFDDLDQDGNGEIDKDELRQFLFDQRMLHSEVF